MFVADATEMATNPAFRLKLALLVAAGLNAAAFHYWPYRSVQAWNQDAASPLAAKTNAVVSLALWTAIIACGRLIAYV